ncbi:hypothetical protein ACKWTF_016742 [Chironomus riparius]
MKKLKLVQILSFLLIISKKVSNAEEPLITCEPASDYYTCTFFHFDTTAPDYRFPSVITHTEDHTNSDVRKIHASENQTISEFPIEIFQTFPNVVHIEMCNVKLTDFSANFTICEQLESLDVQKNNLNKISSGIFKNCKNLKTLKFGFNKISVISEDAFYGLPKVTILEFDNNFLVHIPEKLFVESINLEFLRLNVNLLEIIPNNLFANNPHLHFFPMENNPTLNGILPKNFMANKTNLQFLYIENIGLVDFPDGMFTNTSGLGNLFVSNNKILKIKNGIFDDLQALQKLEFHKNLIENIENDAFFGLPNLKFLKLNENKLKFINIKVFKHVSKLEYLNIENNPIIAISYDIFDVLTACSEFFITIDSVNVHKDEATAFYSNILQCTYYIHETNGYACDLIDGEKTAEHQIVIDNVDQENDVVYLTTSKLELSEIFVEFFETFKTVRFMNFSNNNLGDESLKSLANCGMTCNNVAFLHLSYNNFTLIPSEIAEFSNLAELYMTHNNIKSGNQEVLASLDASVLNILDLSFNQIESFSSYNFKAISLSNNPLQVINPLSSVEFLNLNNFIGHKPTIILKNAFKNSKNLKILFLSNRNIENINLIEFNDALRHLDVSQNQIKVLNFKEVIGLDNFTHLNVSDNFLRNVEPETLVKLTNLQVLDLRSNLIEFVAEFSFKNMTNLTELLLDFNLIKILLKNSFFGLENLKFLSISNNNLKVLDDLIFVPLLSLEFLNLSINSLTSFSVTKFGSVTNLKIFDISKNNIEIMSTNFTDFFPPSTAINMDFNDCSNSENWNSYWK